MSGIMARQPNGKLCRYSTVVDWLTDYNMTDEQYIEMCAEKAREEARDVLQNYLRPYETVLLYLHEHSKYHEEELDEVRKEMEN